MNMATVLLLTLQSKGKGVSCRVSEFRYCLRNERLDGVLDYLINEIK